MGFVVDIMILKETQHREGSHIFVSSNMKIQISYQIEHYQYKAHTVQIITGPVARQALVRLLSVCPLKVTSANHLKIEHHKPEPTASQPARPRHVPTNEISITKIEFWNKPFLSFLCDFVPNVKPHRIPCLTLFSVNPIYVWITLQSLFPKM